MSNEQETPTPIKPPEPDPVDLMLASLETEVHDLDLEKHPFKIKDKEGKILNYSLWELDADQRTEYMNFQAQKAKYSSDGKSVVGVKDIKGLESRLVCFSLHDPDGKPVTEAVINGFPGRLMAKMARIAARISGLDDKAEARAKNS